MAKPLPSNGQSGNTLLDRLAPAEYGRLTSVLQTVALPLKQTLYKARSPVDYVYFPVRGIISAMTVMENGSAIEVATIGNEGMAGVVVFVGGQSSPNDLMVQVEGAALRMRAEVLREECRQDSPLRRILTLYNVAYYTQVSYSVACNGLHTIEKRCCRWLLMTQDRIGSAILPLTHELLGIMLGVRRSSVTEVLRPLQGLGLIRNNWGKIIVLDRAGLEAKVCECYRIVQEEFDRLFSGH